jgi:hypothetical protein
MVSYESIESVPHLQNAGKSIYTQAEMVFGYYHCHPKALTLTLSQRERE